MDLASPHDGGESYPYDTNMVSEVLKRKRKARAIKACFPCRHRKVRCDGNVPCSSCQRRNHVELCVTPSAAGIHDSSSMGKPDSDLRAKSDLCHRPLEYTYSNHTSTFPRDGGDALPNYPTPGSPASAVPNIHTDFGHIDRLIRRLERIEDDISSLKAELIQYSRGSANRAVSSTSNLRSNQSVQYASPTDSQAGVASPASFSIPTSQPARLQSPAYPLASTPNSGVTIPSISGTSTSQLLSMQQSDYMPMSDVLVSAPKRSPQSHFVEEQTGATIFLGKHSDEAIALGCRKAGESLFGSSAFWDQFMPKTYPFTDLWRPVVRPEEICRTLPPDSDILRYWQAYQTHVYPFYPALVTLEQFNASLFEFLDKRSGTSNVSFSFDEIDPSWLALLFAVLALGAQFSEDAVQQREMRSKVFVCSSFQFLRISNIFNDTNLNEIQSMALIGQYLRNNLDTNAAWILLGSTVRLAQSIGLHEEALVGTSTLSPIEQFQRRRFWWMLTWQDTFLSFTYDRPPISANAHCPIPYTSGDYSSDTNRSYAESVFNLCKILQERSHYLNLTISGSLDDNIQLILDYKARFEGIFETAAPFLRDKSFCRTLKDHLERLALHIHVGYTVCRLCRFGLEKIAAEPGDHSEVRRMLSQDCANKAMGVIQCFLDMYRFSATVCRSWAFVHNSVSCCLKLKIPSVAEAAGKERMEDMLSRLLAVLEKEQSASEWFDNDSNKRYYGPYTRVLKALKETYGIGSG